MGDVAASFNINDYIDILKRRRTAFFTFFGATVLIVAIVTFLQTPVYRATALVLVDVEAPQLLTTTVGVGVGPGGGSDYYAYREYFKSQMEIITSETISQKAFDGLDLGLLKEYKKSKTPLKDFIETIKIEPVPETRLLRLNVDDKDPVLAAQIANRIAELYIQRNLMYISSTERLNLLKNEYLRMQTKLAEFSKVYLEGHPEMIKLRQAMAEVGDQMEAEKALQIGSASGASEEATAIRLNYPKANNVSIIDRAKVPVKPIRPQKRLNLLIAVVVGLFGGAGLVFFLDYQDETIKTVEDVEKITKWPVLGAIPDIMGAEKELHSDKKPHDVVTESFKSVITRISFIGDLKTLALTSFGPQEGKTTSICNLSIALAKGNSKVILVDADLRKPRLNKIFGVKGEKGLGAYLSDKTMRQETVQKTGIDNLFLVADRKPTDDPISLLSSARMKEFLEDIKKNSDYVLFDTPPVGLISDALILSKVVDGIILVIESGKTPRKALLRNQKILTESGVRCLGVILVKAPSSGRESYYYSSDYSVKPDKP